MSSFVRQKGGYTTRWLTKARTRFKKQKAETVAFLVQAYFAAASDPECSNKLLERMHKEVISARSSLAPKSKKAQRRRRRSINRLYRRYVEAQ